MRYKRLTLLCAIAVGSVGLGYPGLASAQYYSCLLYKYDAAVE
jgi:hypothetical protein